MPMYDKMALSRKAAELGFQRDMFEKVVRLKRIIEYFQLDEFLKGHFLLKGGTAINLTVFALPRLSVDIDMDYVPNDSREEMMFHRQEIRRQIEDYMTQEGYILANDSRFHHSLDAFHFHYQNSAGNRDMIKIELNYSLRAHVLEPDERVILTKAFGEGTYIKTVHPMEIFAAKANALLTRAAARDLYDFNNMISMNLFDTEKDMFRKLVVFYASISADRINGSFDLSAIDTLTIRKIRRDLFPVLNKETASAYFNLTEYQERAKSYLRDLMRLSDNEMKYIEEFKAGRYHPELLFNESIILERISEHPMALWKCRK